MADDAMYGAMDFEEPAAPAEDMALEEEAEEAMDGELMMHAATLGFSDPAKAEALKAFIERCVALKDEAAYEEPLEGEEAEGAAEEEELPL